MIAEMSNTEPRRLVNLPIPETKTSTEGSFTSAPCKRKFWSVSAVSVQHACPTQPHSPYKTTYIRSQAPCLSVVLIITDSCTFFSFFLLSFWALLWQCEMWWVVRRVDATLKGVISHKTFIYHQKELVFFFFSKRVILLHIHALTLDLEFLEGRNGFLFVSLSAPAQGLKDCRCSVTVYWIHVWRRNKGIELVCMGGGGNW